MAERAEVAGSQSNSSNTLPKHSNNVAIKEVTETTDGQADIDTENYANVCTDIETIRKLSFSRFIYLGSSRILPKSEREWCRSS